MDPDHAAKLAAIRELLTTLPADETAVFMDEVDVNLNPKVGCQWMKRGEQAVVETPGTNEKRYLAGSIHWRTGRVILTGTSKLSITGTHLVVSGLTFKDGSPNVPPSGRLRLF